MFQEAERIACDYSLTRSKDLLFSELYEKIQSMLIESNEANGKIKKQVDYGKFFVEVEGEVKKAQKDLDGVKKALNLLEIAVERPECPEVLKQQQHDVLVLYKDLIRRGYY
jgi:hypothetical protein